MSVSLDNRTCDGCKHIVAELWPRGKMALRCSALGKCKGYVVGFDRPLPYIPAWCPKLKEVEE